MAPNPGIEGRSFAWAFVLFLLAFGFGFFAPVLGFDVAPGIRGVTLGAGGFIPLVIQASTGYALNGRWVAKFSRKEHPTRYWTAIGLSLVVAAWFLFVALNIYARDIGGI